MVLHHDFMPADRPTPPPSSMTMMMTMTVQGPKSDEGTRRRRHKSDEPTAGDTIIDSCWTAGNDKEGSGQEQTTTNHCALNVSERWPAERAAGSE